MSFIWKSPKIEIKQSSIHGEGVFAKNAIKKGELIAIKVGHIVDENQRKEIEKRVGDFWLQIRDNFYLTPLTKKEAQETALYINHSCDPNAGVDGDIGMVAIKNVRKGEEICYDYAMDTAGEYSLECHCGSKLCRKVVTGEDWKRKDLQKRYGIHFAWYLLKKIKGWK